MSADHPDDLPAIAAAMVRAIGEAWARAKDGDRSDDFMDLLRHVRELHVLLLEAFLTAEPNVDERTRGLATAMGNSIDRLQAALNGGTDEL